MIEVVSYLSRPQFYFKQDAACPLKRIFLSTRLTVEGVMSSDPSLMSFESRNFVKVRNGL